MSDLATVPPVPTQPTVATPPAPAPVIGGFVKITNNGPTTLKLPYDSRPWSVDPGQTVVAPFEVANLYFGDPRAGGEFGKVTDEIGRVTFIPDRAAEVRRLALLHDVALTPDGQFPTVGDRVVPTVKVTDLNDSPIVTVLDDPDGTSQQQVNVVPEQEQLRTMLAAQQRQIDELNAKLAQSDPNFSPLTPTLATHVDQQSGVSYISTVAATPGATLDTAIDLAAEGTPEPVAEPAAPPEDTA